MIKMITNGVTQNSKVDYIIRNNILDLTKTYSFRSFYTKHILNS